MKIIKSITSIYYKLSDVGKVLFFISLLLILVTFFQTVKKREGFIQNQPFLFKTGPELYDDFYASIYDSLVFNPIKNDYEIGLLLNKSVANTKSVVLDVGSGTGHHVAKIADSGVEVLGIDISPSMVKQARQNYPDYNFKVANVLAGHEFASHTFTHIICLYFTVYYLQDKSQFFANCINWLKPGGYLFLHLVDREKFDPILPPGNPLFIVSPQKYAKERITKTKVNFNEFVYQSNFKINEGSNIANFEEKFEFGDDGKVRKQEHTFYMEPVDEIVQMAQNVGFIVDSKVDLLKVAYDSQYIYVFQKPGN